VAIRIMFFWKAHYSMLSFIDTHCHLDAAEFNGERNDLVRNAQAAGVHTLVIPSIEHANFEPIKILCLKYPNCVAAYGIHPLYTDRAMPSDLDALRGFLSQTAVAVGEIGLDFFVENYNQTVQEFYFSEQLKLAHEFDLPVLLHSRRAVDRVLKYLRQIKVRGGIAHAFNGSKQQAAEFIKLGFKLGFGGAMTYSRATRLRELATVLPLDSLVLETDAPDIPPDFLERGLPNKPEYLPRIAQTLAALRCIPLEEIAQVITANTRAVLPKLNF